MQGNLGGCRGGQRDSGGPTKRALGASFDIQEAFAGCVAELSCLWGSYKHEQVPGGLVSVRGPWGTRKGTRKSGDARMELGRRAWVPGNQDCLGGLR